MKEIEQYSRPAVGGDLEIAVSRGNDSRQEADTEMDDRPVSTDPQLDMDDMMEGMTEETHLSEMNEHGQTNMARSTETKSSLLTDKLSCRV